MQDDQKSDIPVDIRDTLEAHWPKQFTVTKDDTPTMERVMRRGLVNFADNLRRIMARGVEVRQILKCLDQLANEPGYRLLDRGSVLKRLWNLVPDGPSSRVPRVEVGERPGERPGERNPSASILPPDAWPIKAIREAKGDKDKAIAACPMLGRPHPSGGRMIDMLIFDDECREARGERRAHLPGPRDASELREQAERMRRAVDAAAETDDLAATVEAVGGEGGA